MFADAHCDFLYEAYARKLFLNNNKTYITIDTLRDNVSLQVFAVWNDWRRCAEPFQTALDMIAYYDEHIKPTLMANNIIGVLSIEGCEPLTDINKLHRLYDAGVRIFGLTWNHDNHISGGTGSKAGLTSFGKRFIKELFALGAVCDLAHISRKGFFEALESDVRVMASHANADALFHHPRNLTDEQVLALHQRNAFIGVSMCANFMSDGDAYTSDVVKHMEHILSLTGNPKLLGLGSDFDGAQRYPIDIKSPRDFCKIREGLLTHGVSEEAVEDICYGNLRRFIL